MTNGLTSADSWKFIFYHDQSTGGEFPKWSADLAKPETVRGLSIVLNADYRTLTRLRVTFDGDPKSAVELALKPAEGTPAGVRLPRRALAKSITLEPLSWTPHEKRVIGVDNLWLKVEKPAEWAAKVRPLTNVGGLVRYPMGPGGVVLNQLNVAAVESNPENAAKKRAVVATLLRNLGAAFAQVRVVVPGENLATTPLELGAICNAYLDAERFPGGSPGLPTLPLGEQTFAGVRYAVRDFRTSPLPAALLVEPNAAPATLAVGRRADALFFLAAAVKTPERPDEKRERTLATVRVKYADGQTADIPVKLGEQVGPWRVPEARALPQGRVAYSLAVGRRGQYAVPGAVDQPAAHYRSRVGRVPRRRGRRAGAAGGARRERRARGGSAVS